MAIAAVPVRFGDNETALPREELATMTDYNIKIPSSLLSSLLGEGRGFGPLIEDVLNQLLEAQVTEQLGAERYERNSERGGYRNGVRYRTLYTRVGPVTLRVPQLRDGSFSTEIFGRYQR